MQIRQPEKLLIFLSINEYIANVSLYAFSKPLCLNVSTTPIVENYTNSKTVEQKAMFTLYKATVKLMFTLYNNIIVKSSKV